MMGKVLKRSSSSVQCSYGLLSSQAGQHKVLSLNKSFSHFQSVPAVFVFCNGCKMFPVPRCCWVFGFFIRQGHASYQIQSTELSQRSGLLILGSSQLSSQTICALFSQLLSQFPCDFRLQGTGPTSFRELPPGAFQCFFKRFTTETFRVLELRCCLVWQHHIIISRLGCKHLGYFSSVGDLVRKTYFLLQKNHKCVDLLEKTKLSKAALINVLIIFFQMRGLIRLMCLYSKRECTAADGRRQP